MNYSADPLAADESERVLAEIRADPAAWFEQLLPKRLVQDGGAFVCLVQMTARPGMVDSVIEYMTAVHEETDRNELDVYAHRCMQGKFDVDELSIGLIIEYDEPQAFLTHYRGQSISSFYKAGLLSAPPRLSFYRDF